MPRLRGMLTVPVVVHTVFVYTLAGWQAGWTARALYMTYARCYNLCSTSCYLPTVHIKSSQWHGLQPSLLRRIRLCFTSAGVPADRHAIAEKQQSHRVCCMDCMACLHAQQGRDEPVCCSLACCCGGQPCFSEGNGYARLSVRR